MNDITINKTLYQCYLYNQQVGISYKHRSDYSMYSNITNGYYYEYFCPSSKFSLEFASPIRLNIEYNVCSCCNRIDSFFLFNRTFNIAVDYVMEMCSLLGLYIGLGFVLLFLREKSLRTPYGILCFWQALFDFIILTLIGIFETPINFINDMWINRLYEVPDWIKTYVLFVINLWPYQPFLMFSAKTISIIMRLMKTGVRFWALYFPISFQMKLTNKLALQGIFLVTTLVILLFIPQLIFLEISGGNVCDIELFQLYLWHEDTCSSIYYIIYTYSDGLIAICCVTLDILCIIKFRKIYANNTAIAATSSAERTKRRQEKIMIIQNCANISVFIFAYVPLIYSLIIPNDRNVQSFNIYFVQCSNLLYDQNTEILVLVTSPYENILEVLTKRSLKRSIGHMLDGAFTLYLQHRLARANKGEVTITQVSSTIVPTPNKLTYKEKFQKFLARL